MNDQANLRRAAVPLLLAASVCGACKSTPRPPAPPTHEVYKLPFGAVPFEAGEARHSALDLDIDFEDILRTRLRRMLQESPDGSVHYKALAISGGGSRGAYGAGILAGWTELGTRPEFDVVTGVSTGALMATHAFLGSEFDDGLQIFRRVDTEDILSQRGKLAALNQDALFDSDPLRQILLDYLTDDVLDAVTREYTEGRRLFVGTTNLDANAFTVWDMGVLAASPAPDRRDRYVDVILASASFPMIFPPVYIKVETEGEPYYQMHVDGAIRENVFYFDFNEDMQEILLEVGSPEKTLDLFMLHNGTLFATGEYQPLEGKVTSIAVAALNGLLRKSTISSIYRVLVTTLIHGASFHLAFIPPGIELQTSPLEFDREEMRMLFDLGYEASLNGSAWYTQLPPSSEEQLIEGLDPSRVFDDLEARPEFRSPGTYLD